MHFVDILRQMRRHLAALERADLLREPVVVQTASGPTVRVRGREVLCFCSNDYLSLAADPAVKAAATDAIQRWGVGAGASRLVSGTLEPHVELERQLARFKGTEAAIVTSTGWMANHVAVHALAGRGDLILCDKLNHASIIDAAMSSGARVRTYAHGNTDRLVSLLARHRNRHRRCLIVTDSLFSMDGDMAPLDELVRIKSDHGAQLLIDEAHATGVLGSCGRGAAELFGVEEDIDATVGTLSKAVGALGGFVAGPSPLIDIIRNTGRAYVYTTALPPAICAAATESLRIIRDEPRRRRRLLELAERLRAALERQGMDTRGSASQIVPVVIGGAARAVRAAGRLLEAGFLVSAIRPPTVPKGTSRLRVSLCATHDPQDVERLADLLCRIIKSEGKLD